jgi:hypothetical protein
MYHGTYWPTGGVNLTCVWLLEDNNNLERHCVRLEVDGGDLRHIGTGRVLMEATSNAMGET